MVDHVHTVHELGGHRGVLDAPDRVVEVRVPLEVLDVVDAAGGEVVEDVDLVTAKQTSIREMGADKSGAAGDQNAHLYEVSEGGLLSETILRTQL